MSTYLTVAAICAPYAIGITAIAFVLDAWMKRGDSHDL